MSDDKRNKTTVDIYGQPYTIVGTESASHMRLVASMVDEKMREIRMKNPHLDTSKLAVLTAVNTIHEYIKLKDELDQLQLELKREKD
ncbi:cell division protein ZapA [Peribacillus frigoritolerans]|uniref:cell division protein ZapA n=1 Tax=Peribacillus TaxID=2675229 RepID=UPI00054D9CCE|nr:MULTISPECIES: cell division protein ZapA [Peribacillus]KRF54459.1 cell division protein ZapA [Bacillus sp. Soil745]MBD8134773.1 cell division protein ZapA [Bacillus sp. CFBP 13597]PAW26915.1 cell division protein ZapA [Peribacillus simplex]PEF36613.1 cell division protein ZapA [Bacillus sp. AFS094228]PEO45055.1 cell division protein ZapA [Bacillus sp. AFS026049]PHD71249.1 cell division protein ZapA [Bacillus sp. AFS043905]PRS44241.1 cell division protein ZapA [Bacillus sp. RJGP41]QNK4829